jgi:hypothetical protein
MIELVYNSVEFGFAFGIRSGVTALPAGIKFVGFIVTVFAALGALAVFNWFFIVFFGHIILLQLDIYFRKYNAPDINKS